MKRVTIPNIASRAGGILFLLLVVMGAPGPSAWSLDSDALHAPPATYQALGACQPNVGRLYQQPSSQGNSPILFYTRSGLTAIAFLMTEQDLRDNQTATILGDLGPLPITEISFGPSTTNPFSTARVGGPYYLLMMRVDQKTAGSSPAC